MPRRTADPAKTRRRRDPDGEQAGREHALDRMYRSMIATDARIRAEARTAGVTTNTPSTEETTAHERDQHPDHRQPRRPRSARRSA